MSAELRGPQDAERWLCAKLCLARQEGPTPEGLSHGIPRLLAALAEALALPPPAIAQKKRMPHCHRPLPEHLPAKRMESLPADVKVKEEVRHGRPPDGYKRVMNPVLEKHGDAQSAFAATLFAALRSNPGSLSLLEEPR